MAWFLFNEHLFELEDRVDPWADPGFPLTREQFEDITVGHIMNLLTEAMQANPGIVSDKPRLIISICRLLNAKQGINVLRAEDDGRGVSAVCGQIPVQTLTILGELRDRGTLNRDTINEAVWRPLGR